MTGTKVDEKPVKNHGRGLYPTSGILVGGARGFASLPAWPCSDADCHAAKNYTHRGLCSVCGAPPCKEVRDLQIEFQTTHLDKRPLASIIAKNAALKITTKPTTTQRGSP